MKSAIRKAGPVPTSEGNTSCWQGTSTHLPGKMHRTGFFAPLIFVVSGNRHHEFYDSMSICWYWSENMCYKNHTIIIFHDSLLSAMLFFLCI